MGRLTWRWIPVPLLGLVFFPVFARAWLSPAAPTPVWSRLEPYQKTLTRDEFVSRVKALYSTDAAFLEYATVHDDRVVLFQDATRTTPVWTYYFAPTVADRRPPPRRFFRPAPSLGMPPLQGRTICLDPGHIGGEWAKPEERWFQLDPDPPIEEAELNLRTCRLLEKLLQQAGAKVVWTKENREPVTSLRPRDLRAAALRTLPGLPGWPAVSGSPAVVAAELEKRATLLFYRTAEIQARAARVAALLPDLTICLHYNAAPWAEPRRENLTDDNRLVVFVHGMYLRNELVYEDQRYDLMAKLLEQSSDQELAVAEKVATRMAAALQLPPETYATRLTVMRAGSSPYVFARNLLASRLFPGPVVFVEGPYMNSKEGYARLVQGDYDGERIVNGRAQRSVFRDYAEAVAAGVIDYYLGNISAK